MGRINIQIFKLKGLKTLANFTNKVNYMNMNESDPRSGVHYLGSSENKA